MADFILKYGYLVLVLGTVAACDLPRAYVECSSGFKTTIGQSSTIERNIIHWVTEDGQSARRNMLPGETCIRIVSTNYE